MGIRLKDFAKSIQDRSRQLRRSAGAAAMRAWAGLREEVGRDEVYLYGGLILIAIGLWNVWRPGSFIAPGAAFVWISMPKRTAFIERTAPEEKKKG